MDTIENIDNNLLDLCEPVMIRTLLFGSNSFDTDANTNVLNATIEYILSTKRFDEPLFQWKQNIFKQAYESVHSAFIDVVTCINCKFLFLRICFIPGYPYSFRYLVIVSFNFTVYDIIYIYIYIKTKKTTTTTNLMTCLFPLSFLRFIILLVSKYILMSVDFDTLRTSCHFSFCLKMFPLLNSEKSNFPPAIITLSSPLPWFNVKFFDLVLIAC